MDLRPTPGTADLLEVLDRSVSGGISIDAGSEPIVLASGSTEARIAVTTTEPYLEHSEVSPVGLSLASPPEPRLSTVHDRKRY